MSETPRITAVLGPTNTGKTHLAMERLLGYRTGMIGFPLRLLARENYDKAVAIKGAAQVALITGEEKIVPPTANYYFCTVESMPLTAVRILSRWTKCNFALIRTAAISSPIACSQLAERWRRCSSARKPSAR